MISMIFCFFSGAAMLGIVVVIKVLGFVLQGMIALWFLTIPIVGYLTIPIIYKAALKKYMDRKRVKKA